MDVRPVDQLVFLHLAGELPPQQALPVLPQAQKVYHSVTSAFSAYLSADAAATCCEDLAALPICAGPGWTILYLYGHAWPSGEGYETSVVEGGLSSVIDGETLLDKLAKVTNPASTILIIDTCHAARLLPLAGASHSFRLVVVASGPDESAIALPIDRTTRLATALHRALRIRRGPLVDLLLAVTAVRSFLMRDGVVLGQSVDYALHGPSVWLSRSQHRPPRLRYRTTRLVVGSLAACFSVAGVALTWAVWFYSQHALVEVGLNDLPNLLRGGHVVVYRQEPERNAAVEVRRVRIDGGRLRLWVPAGNMVLQVEGDFRDGATRKMAFPLLLPATVRLRQKLVTLTLPPAAAVARHPDMAYIPVRELRIVGAPAPPPTPDVNLNDPNLACAPEVEAQVVMPGIEPSATLCATPRASELASLSRSYWIDLAPPTVDEYVALATAMVGAERITRDQVLLFAFDDRLTAPPGPLIDLTRLVAEAVRRLETATLPNPAGQSSPIFPAFALPCASCPAPMGGAEAQNYCAVRGARLPSFDEWLLATGGVDARIYPWGNRFDPALAHVPGLPTEVGRPNTLLPVHSSGTGVSPFGLIDTVGNAGDWLDDPDEMPRIYVGGTYHGNPEDATVRSQLSNSTPDEQRYEVTARCVVPAG